MEQIAITGSSSGLPTHSTSTPSRAKRLRSPASHKPNDDPDDDEEESSPDSELDEVQSAWQEVYITYS